MGRKLFLQVCHLPTENLQYFQKTKLAAAIAITASGKVVTIVRSETIHAEVAILNTISSLSTLTVATTVDCESDDARSISTNAKRATLLVPV